MATVLALGIAPAAAQAAAGQGGSTAGSHRGCAAAQLTLSVPASIKGDAIDGMGKLSWNILLRNTGSACSLAGWPALRVHSAGGKLVAIKTTDATDSNLAAVPDRTVLLGHGQQAVVTVQGTDNTPGCAAGWALRVTLPGAAGSLSAAQPAAAFGPCGGGQLALSPFYSRATLTKDIKALSVSASPSVYRTTNARMPGACTAQRMRVASSYSSTGRYGTVEVLRLASRGSQSCVLAGMWPTVVLHSSTGASQIAKALPVPLPRGVVESPLLTYKSARGQQTDLTLRPGSTASVALIAQPKSAGSCRVAKSVTFYPTTTDAGTGLTAGLSKPLTFCGLPRELSFLAGRPSAGTLQATAKKLAQAQAGVQPNGDSPTGFWYGSDSNFPVPTSSSGGVWQMPDSPTGGAYGGYVGEIGAYTNWQGCGSGLNWQATAYNDAQSNITNHSAGVGAGVYWMMAGAGREANYSSTNATTATNWGTAQATRAASDVSQPLSFPYVFMDIEAADPHGWNEAFAGPCSGTEVAGSVPAAIDRDTFNGFWDYIENHTAFLVSVYCAGGAGGSSWSAIFGSQTLGSTAEWTYVNETPSLSTFPSSFSVGGTSALWFASAPGNCQMLWQWSGGDGVLNRVGGDFDQIDQNRTFVCV